MDPVLGASIITSVIAGAIAVIVPSVADRRNRGRDGEPRETGEDRFIAHLEKTLQQMSDRADAQALRIKHLEDRDEVKDKTIADQAGRIDELERYDRLSTERIAALTNWGMYSTDPPPRTPPPLPSSWRTP